jgi:ketosteroid isomerase-like protein
MTIQALKKWRSELGRVCGRYYLINVARTEYREELNTGDADRVVSVFAPEFTDNSDGRPSRYGKDAPAKLRQHLKGLFAEYQTNLNLITPAIVISGNLAYDYGYQELTLTAKKGGEARGLPTTRSERAASARSVWPGVAAAITSAVHHATGVCVRELSVRIEHLLA